MRLVRIPPRHLLTMVVIAVLLGPAGLVQRVVAAGGGTGAISVSSDPRGAAVYVDGAFAGQTPLNVAGVSTGDHRVRIVKDGYLENARVVTVGDGRTGTVLVRLTARASQAGAPQAAGGLQIRVIQGEDSVNIIQTKTAVAPIVEVRDRNNLPVSGASVVFTLGGGSGNAATLANGVQQVTVTTDAAGRATTTVNPTNPGPVQISVQASFMGLTGTAVVNQTNYLTAALAGQAATAAAGAAAAGSGGGLPGLAIAGIAVAGGTTAGIFAVKAINKNQAPIVSSLTAAPTSGLLGLNTAIAFTVDASDPDNDSLNFTWDFGDGGTENSSNKSTTHTYTTAGTFTAKVTASDGKDTATNQTTVTIRSLSGSWRSDTISSVAGAAPMVFGLTQSGNALTGTFTQGAGSGPVTNGSLKSAAPQVTFTVTPSISGQTLQPFTFTGNLSGNFNTMTGALNGSGFVNEPITVTRQ